MGRWSEYWRYTSEPAHSPLRIAVVARQRMPAQSASSLQVMKMCSAFAGNGDEVVLICAKEPGTPSRDPAMFSRYGVDPTFRIRRLPRRDWRGGKHLFALAAAGTALMNRVDLVHTRCVWSGLSAVRLGLPVLYELHTLPRPTDRRMQALLTLSRHARFVRLVVTSDVLREDLLARYPKLRSPVLVAPNGADVRAPANPVSLPADGLKVGYVGSLYEGKGAEVVLALARSCGWAQFHLVGGTAHDVERVSGQCAGLANVHFHGFLPHSEAMRYVDAFDVLLAPYQEAVVVHGGRIQSGRWMTPIKLFEYMAAGKPVIVSDLPVAREILASGDGQSGFLCPPTDLRCWAHVLKRLSADPELRTTVGLNARRLVQSRYTWTNRAREVRRAFLTWRDGAPPPSEPDRISGVRSTTATPTAQSSRGTPGIQGSLCTPTEKPTMEPS
jgi:glycosyltransferase involved in cell wall biosynthesis